MEGDADMGILDSITGFFSGLKKKGDEALADVGYDSQSASTEGPAFTQPENANSLTDMLSDLKQKGDNALEDVGYDSKDASTEGPSFAAPEIEPARPANVPTSISNPMSVEVPKYEPWSDGIATSVSQFSPNFIDDYYGDTNKKYEQMIADREKARADGLNGQIGIGESGYMAPSDIAENAKTIVFADGNPSVDRDWNGDGKVEGWEAVSNGLGNDDSPYITKEYAMELAKSGFGNADTVSYINSMEDAEDKDILSKSDLQRHGFIPYVPDTIAQDYMASADLNDLMEGFWGDVSRLRRDSTDWTTSYDGQEISSGKDFDRFIEEAISDIANGVESEKWSLYDESGRKVSNPRMTDAFYDNVRDQEAGIVTIRMDVNYDDGSEPIYKRFDVDYAFPDGENLSLTLSDFGLNPQVNYMQNGKEIRIPFNLDAISAITANPTALNAFDRGDVSIEELVNQSGRNADYGPLGWNTPNYALSGFDKILNPFDEASDFIPAITDMALSSAGYFMPQTLAQRTASGMSGAFNGVDYQNSMNRKDGSYEGSNNIYTSPLAYGLAGLAERSVSGAIGKAGKTTSLDDMILRGLSRAILPNSEKAGANILRNALASGIGEGVEEVITSPIYEFAESDPEYMYASNLKDEYGNDIAGEYDESTPLLPDVADLIAGRNTESRVGNWIDTIPNDFLGGALLGGPIGGLSGRIEGGKYAGGNRSYYDMLQSMPSTLEETKKRREKYDR